MNTNEISLEYKQNTVFNILKDKVHTEILFGGGAGGGKSFIGCVWLLGQCMQYPGTRWLMGRAKLKTLKETTLVTLFDLFSKVKMPPSKYNYNQQEGTITFINGSVIILKDLFLYPSDPNFDSLGSLEITGAFVDEANQITEKAKNILKSRIRYNLDENGLIPKLLMTCNPAKNWVYSEFYKPQIDGNIEPYKIFIQALIEDNSSISKHYKENLLTLDEVSKQRLLYGNWEYDNDPTRLVDYDSILNIWQNDFVASGQKYITADIARMGKDKAVIMLWNGLRIEQIKVLPVGKLTELGDIIIKLKNDNKVPHSNIIADEDGVGGGIVDFLHIKGFQNGSAPLNGDNYANLKTQCYYKLSELINSGAVFCATDIYKDEIIEELSQVKTYQIDTDSKLKILPKEKVKEIIGRSPDFSDTIMMRMFFELSKKGTYAIY